MLKKASLSYNRSIFWSSQNLGRESNHEGGHYNAQTEVQERDFLAKSESSRRKFDLYCQSKQCKIQRIRGLNEYLIEAFLVDRSPVQKSDLFVGGCHFLSFIKPSGLQGYNLQLICSLLVKLV